MLIVVIRLWIKYRGSWDFFAHSNVGNIRCRHTHMKHQPIRWTQGIWRWCWTRLSCNTSRRLTGSSHPWLSALNLIIAHTYDATSQPSVLNHSRKRKKNAWNFLPLLLTVDLTNNGCRCCGMYYQRKWRWAVLLMNLIIIVPWTLVSAIQHILVCGDMSLWL